MSISNTDVITTDALTKIYKGTSAVQDLSLTVPRHSISSASWDPTAPGKVRPGARWVINLAVAEWAIRRRPRSQYVPSAMNAV